MKRTTSSPAELALERWVALSDHLDRWYYDVDKEALRIALAVGISHGFLDDDPVWLFIVGVSGSGKSIPINCLSTLLNAYIIGDLTASTFLSGYNEGKGKFGFLKQVGTNALFLFKDFTTFLSKRPEVRGEIASQMREIYDGCFTKPTGASTFQQWEGKVTCIAACTPVLERAWAVHREMGERWVQVRWRDSDSYLTSEKAALQINNSREITKELKRLASIFMDQTTLHAARPLTDLDQLIHLAHLISLMRCQVNRDSHPPRTIVDIPRPEKPTRLIKAMAQIARAHATLFRREIEAEDLAAARRVGLDSIPEARMRFMMNVPDKSSISQGQLQEMSGIPMSTVAWIAEELAALDIITTSDTSGQRHFAFTEKFQALKLKALAQD